MSSTCRTLQRCSAAYNHLIPPRNLGHLTPVDALRHWYDKKPELFRFDPHNLPGPDTYVVVSELHGATHGRRAASR